MCRPSKYPVSLMNAGDLEISTSGCAMKLRGSALIFSANRSCSSFDDCGAHQHSVTAGLVGALDHQLVQVRQYIVALLVVRGEVGRYVGNERLLVKIVT